MPLTNQNIYDAVVTILREPSNTFRQRCIGSILRQAPVIAAESRGVANHTQRRALALTTLKNGGDFGPWIPWIATHATITGTASLAAVNAFSDAQIDTIIEDVWDARRRSRSRGRRVM